MSRLERDLTEYAASLSPSEAERQRILSRLSQRPQPSEAPGWPRPRAWAIAAAVLAAGAALWLWTSASAERALGPSDRWESLTAEIAVQPMGRGSWDGRNVRWEEGTVRVSVTPDQGVRLRILTAEAVIEVVGTIFSVTRDEHGTRVAVERGKVSTACLGEAAALSGAGERHSCFRSADAGLGLAMAMEAQGAPVEAWLPEAQRALVHPEGSEAARTALRAMAVDGLLSRGALQEAVEAARPWLSLPEGSPGEGSSASEAVGALARALLDDPSSGSSRCAQARPWLSWLARRGDGVAALWLADCAEDPVERTRALQQALEDDRPEVQRAARARLEQPGTGGR